MKRIKTFVTRLILDQRGEGFLDVALKILIVVVIGMAVLAVLQLAVPGLFTNLVNKVSTELAGVATP